MRHGVSLEPLAHADDLGPRRGREGHGYILVRVRMPRIGLAPVGVGERTLLVVVVLAVRHERRGARGEVGEARTVDLAPLGVFLQFDQIAQRHRDGNVYPVPCRAPCLVLFAFGKPLCHLIAHGDALGAVELHPVLVARHFIERAQGEEEPSHLVVRKDDVLESAAILSLEDAVTGTPPAVLLKRLRDFCAALGDLRLQCGLGERSAPVRPQPDKPRRRLVVRAARPVGFSVLEHAARDKSRNVGDFGKLEEPFRQAFR